LTAGGAWLLAAAILLGLGQRVSLVGAGALILGLGLFALQLGRLYRLRRRRTFDIHIPFAIVATASGLLALGLACYGLASSRPASDSVWRAAGWLAIVGWAETAIQGFLYKIGAFLTWLHRYAPLAGRRRVPKLEDLYGRRTALLGWAAWTFGVGGGAVAILTGLPWLAPLAGAALSLGLGGLLVNACRIGWHWRRAEPLPAESIRQPASTSASTGRSERPVRTDSPQRAGSVG